MLDDLYRLFEHTADGVWISGADGEILFWNRAAEEILGHSKREALGQKCREVLAGRDRHGNRVCAWPCPVKLSCSAGDLVRHFEMATRTSAGRPVWIDVSCIVVPAFPGAAPTLVHLFRDITAARQVDELLRQQLTPAPWAVEEEPPSRLRELTPRERQVLDLIRTGATTAQIARQLCISKATVRNHVQSMFAKLDVHSRLEAVAYLMQHEPSTAAARASR